MGRTADTAHTTPQVRAARAIRADRKGGAKLVFCAALQTDRRAGRCPLMMDRHHTQEAVCA